MGIWDYPTAILETSVGNFQVSFTDANHVHVTNYGSGVSYGYGAPEGVDFTVTAKGAQLNVSTHLWKWQGDVWTIGREDQGLWERQRTTYVSRVGDSKDPTKGMVLVVADAIVDAFAKWIVTEEAQAMAQFAEIQAAMRDIDRAQKGEAEAKAKHDAAKRETRAAQRRLKRAREAATSLDAAQELAAMG